MTIEELEQEIHKAISEVAFYKVTATEAQELEMYHGQYQALRWVLDRISGKAQTFYEQKSTGGE